jgi:hypothetical protein
VLFEFTPKLLSLTEQAQSSEEATFSVDLGCRELCNQGDLGMDWLTSAAGQKVLKWLKKH